MAEGPDAVFSGGKRAHDGEDDRPAPILGGRKQWIYNSASGGGRGGRGGGRGGRGGSAGDRGGGRGGAAGRGTPAGRYGGGSGYQLGGYSSKKRR